MHGAGNDFVLLPDYDDHYQLTESMVRLLCDRRRGIGGDGVIRAGAPRAGVDADIFMDYRNADGSVAEMCGNGVRTIAKWLADRWSSSDADIRGFARDPVRGSHDIVAVDTRGGVKDVEVHRGPDGLVATCTVDMGAPVVGDVGRDLVLDDGRSVAVTTLSMGNPHAVLLVDDVDGAPVADLGPVIEAHPAFADGTNVEFIRALDRGTVAGRIWERGVGETLASGTGGSAMAVAAAMNGLTDRQVDVRLPGGTLSINWTDQTLFVTGPAVEVASGVLDPAFASAIGVAALPESARYATADNG